MASNTREERRRRIVERGNDRMALITGQVRTLNASQLLSSPTSKPINRPHHAHTESSPSIMFSSNDHTPINANPEGENEASGTKLVKLRTINECSGTKSFDMGNQMQPKLVKSMTTPEIIKTPVFDSITKTGSSNRVTPSVPKALTPPSFFSSKRVNSSIMASEKIRAMSSLIIAFLVVMTSIENPLVGFNFNIVNSENFIVSRPFCIILLTDVAIVLARMFCETGVLIPKEVEEERKADGDNWEEAVKVLERASVLYHSSSAIFIDCSIYLVVVIGSLSLLL